MKNRKQITKSYITIILISVFFTGCASMDDGQKTTAQGTGLGALIGAAIGYGVSGKDGAAIGAVLGAGAGGAYGQKIAQQKEEYASAEDFYQETITTVSSENEHLVRANIEATNNIESLAQAIELANTKSLSYSDRQSQLVKAKNFQKEEVANNKKLIKEYTGELEYASVVLDDLKANSGTNSIQYSELSQNIAALEDNITQLEDSNNQLAQLDPSML